MRNVHSLLYHSHHTRPELNFPKTIVLFWKFIGTHETFYWLSQLFDVSISSDHNIIGRILCAIVPGISNKLIKWPSCEELIANGVAFQQTIKLCFLL
jgi:hypothetical protein